MGKIQLLTKEQKIILLGIAQSDFLQKQFYFTGGTALSAVYLAHRYSEDLDLFSEKPFDGDEILMLVNGWVEQYNIEVTRRQNERVHVYFLTFPSKSTLKVDFVHHPYKRIEKGKLFQDIQVDSLLDIATNKLLTINQRSEVKDFVDLYFLLKEFTIWDLMEGIAVKYRMRTELLFVAEDFTKVEDFDVMPRMIKSLTLEELKTFFREKAKEVGRRVTE